MQGLQQRRKTASHKAQQLPSRGGGASPSTKSQFPCRDGGERLRLAEPAIGVDVVWGGSTAAQRTKGIGREERIEEYFGWGYHLPAHNQFAPGSMF